MKLFKSILSLVLAFAILPLGAHASSSDYSYVPDYYDSQLSFISSVGIVENIDATDYSRIVTRAEFAHMAVNMLNISTAAPVSTVFSDVAADTAHADAVYTALSYGLLKGTSEGTFSPEKPITYAAAIKILVAALGYEEYAFVSGGYPSGYIMQADKIGLLDGINTYSVDDSLEFAAVVGLISNALTCDLRKIASVSGEYVETTVIKGQNCLTEYFDLSHTSGIVTTAGYHSMIHGYNEEDSFVQIGELTLKCNITDAHKYLGYSVDAWYNPSTKQAVTLRTDSVNSSVVIDADMVDSYSDFKLLVYTDDDYNTKTYSLDKGYSFVLNGRLTSPTDSDFTFKHGTLTLIDNNGDKRYDVVCSNRKSYMVVRGVNPTSKIVYDARRNDMQLVLDNEEGYHYTMTADGAPVDHSYLKVDMVLEVAQSRDGFISDVTVSTESIRGTITGLGTDEVYIDDVLYIPNEYFKAYCTPELGQSGTFLLDPNGRVTYISDLYINSVQYGYFLDMQVKENFLSPSDVRIKVFTEDGRVENFLLTEKITFDGGPKVFADSIYDELMITTSAGNKIPHYQLIRFGTDADGLVNLIDTADPVVHNADLNVKYTNNVSDNSLTKYVDATVITQSNAKAFGNSYWREQGRAFVPFFTAGSAVIMKVPEAIITAEIPADREDHTAPIDSRFDDSAFSIIGAAAMDDSRWVYVDAYDYDESMTPKIIILYEGTAKPGDVTRAVPGTNEPIHLVERVVSCVNEDGEQTKRIYSYSEGEFRINDIAPEVLADMESNNLIPQTGEAIRLSFSGKYVNGIARDVYKDAQTGNFEVSYGSDGVGTTPIDTLTYVTGKVFSCVDTSLVIKTDNYPTDTRYATPIDGLCSLRVTSNTVFVVLNTQTGLVEHGSISEISDIRSVGETDATYVCVGMGAFVPEFVIIYR